MGKAARQAERSRSRRSEHHAARRHPAAVAAAALADELFTREWAAVEADYQQILNTAFGSERFRIRLDVDEVHAAVASARNSGLDWLPATYVPGSILGALLGRELLAEFNEPIPNDEASLHGLEQFGTVFGPRLAILAGWHRAPLVAQFDADLSHELIATPMSGNLPHLLLQRLPAWTVFIPTPWLAADAGVFVTYDVAETTRDGIPLADVEEAVDDLMIMFATPHSDAAVIVYVRCSEPTIEASIAAQDQEITANPDPPPWLRGAKELFSNLFGRPYRQTLEEVMSLVLYLCSDEPDTEVVRLPRRGNLRSPGIRRDRDVVEVGYRLGAALRAHHYGDSTRGVGTHTRPVPHVRSAHWHTYWYGPRSDPAARTTRLRWLSPILVGVHDDTAVDVTVRPVHPDNGSPADPP